MSKISYNLFNTIDFTLQKQNDKIESVGFNISYRKDFPKKWIVLDVDEIKEEKSNYGQTYLDGFIVLLDKKEAEMYYKTLLKKSKTKIYLHAVFYTDILTVGHIPIDEYVYTSTGKVDHICGKAVTCESIKGIRRIK